MGDLIGFAYFVFGGVVTGRVLYAMWLDDAFKLADGEDFPFYETLIMAMLFWLAWPVVWGIDRARRAAKPHPRPKEEDRG